MDIVLLQAEEVIYIAASRSHFSTNLYCTAPQSAFHSWKLQITVTFRTEFETDMCKEMNIDDVILN